MASVEANDRELEATVVAHVPIFCSSEVLSHDIILSVCFGVCFAKRRLSMAVPLFLDRFDELLWRLFFTELALLIIYHPSDGSLESIINVCLSQLSGIVILPILKETMFSKSS